MRCLFIVFGIIQIDNLCTCDGLLSISLKFTNRLHMNQSTDIHTPILKKIQNYSFDLTQKLGQGSFSQVFRGVNLLTNKPVAVKKIRTGDMKSKIAKRLFQCEISTLKIVSHYNIIRCYDVCSSVNNCYLITEICEEGDVDELLKREGKININQIAKIIYAMYQALRYLSQVGIIHRDLKVSNIFRRNGSYVLGDFGFAIQAKRLFKDVAIGSPLYMSPQGLIHNLYGPKTDIWALGVLMYELIHGVTPLSSCKTQQQLRKNVLLTPQIDENVSDDLKELIFACLTINEQERINIDQIGQSRYIKRIAMQLETTMDIEKDFTITAASTMSFVGKNHSPLPEITYDTAVTLINYCRLIDKISKLISSVVFSQHVLWWSVGLLGAKVSMKNVTPEKQANLRGIIKDYYEKYLKQHQAIVPYKINLQQMRKECELKIQMNPQNSTYLKYLLRETELLMNSLEEGGLQFFSRRSKSRQYANNTPNNS